MDFPSKLSGKQGMKASLLVLVRSLPSFDFMTVIFDIHIGFKIINFYRLQFRGKQLKVLSVKIIPLVESSYVNLTAEKLGVISV